MDGGRDFAAAALILLHSLFVVEVQGLDTLEGGFKVLYVCGGGVGVPARRYALVL